MFKGNYNFFDYKYNISGYTGQDYGSFAQSLYLIISIILLIGILILLRKISKEKVIKIVKFTGIFLIIFYIVKTSWESYYDIKLNGSFNTGLLPFDTCSIIMWACLIGGFSKGKIQKYALSWLTTGGIVGGLGAMLYLNAFKYYPFFSFGAFYSMIWHLLMVFTGLLLIVTKTVSLKYDIVVYGFIFHLIISLFVIPIDIIYNFDFMLYLNLGGIPLFESVADKLSLLGLGLLNPLLMLLLYFISFNIIYFVYMILYKISNSHFMSFINNR